MGSILTTKGFNLNPDLVASARSGLTLRGQITRQEELEGQLGREQKTRELIGQALGPKQTQPGQEPIDPDVENQSLAELFTVNPQAAIQLQEQLGLRDKKRLVEAADFAFKIDGLPIERQNQLIQERIQRLESQGRNSSNSQELLTLDPEGRSRAIRTVQLLALSPEQRLKVSRGLNLTSAQREFRSDIELGRLTKEEIRDAVRIKRGLKPKASGVSAKVFDIGGVPHIIKADGTVQRVIVDGDNVTTETVSESEAAIVTAKKLAEGQAKLTSKTIEKGFNSIAGINKNIRNIDRALGALDRGAGTGAVERFLPSIKAASVELNQIQGELALDVVGSVTFGALSQGELDLARDIALPTGLDEPALRDWLNRKKIAQSKLRDYFNEQIQFLDGGGTVPEFLASKRKDVEAQTGQRDEGTIMVDAQGNRARVFADGTFEEL